MVDTSADADRERGPVWATWFFLWLAIYFGPAGAVQAPQPIVLTLERAEAIVRSRNLELQAVRYTIRAAEGRARQYTVMPNPEVETEIFFTEEKTLRILQPLRWPGQTRILQALGSYDTASARADYHRRQLDIIHAVRLQWITVLTLQERLAILARSQQIAEEMLRNARMRYARGFGNRQEVALANIEVGRVRARIERLQAQHATQVRLLQQMLQLDRPIRIEDRLDTLIEWTPPPHTDVAAIVRRHPLVVQAQMRASYWSTRRDWERTLRRPKIAVGPSIGLFEGGRLSPGIAFAVTIPVWDTRQGRISEAEAQRQFYVRLLEARMTLLRHRLEAFCEQYARLRSNLETYRTTVLDRTEQLVHHTRAGYRAGQIPFLTYIEAVRTWVDTRLEYLEMLHELARTVMDIRYITDAAREQFHDTVQIP